jgi:mxaA protein
MTKHFRKLLLAAILSFTSQQVMAVDSQLLPDVDEGVVDITTVDPYKRVGYTVGDVIERKVTLTIKAPYKLIETSLPIVGYEKRYRGKVIGIELKNIEHNKVEQKDYTTHQIKLAYQVFTNSVVAKNAALGPEYLNLINTKNSKQLVKYRIPSLDIAVSPLSIFGQVKVENNMSPFLEPLLIKDDEERKWLKIAVSVLTLSLLALLYMLGKHAWLPRMGGSFAKAYRTVKKLPHDEAGLKQAISAIHLSFNQTAKMSVFNDNVDEFIKNNPNFSHIKSEISQFFGLSRQVYFEPNAQHNVGNNPSQWLLKFTRQCRDCERGLIPTTNKAGA